jgi:hypothetical protein
MTALMAMPFGYVGIEHVSISFAAPYARAPLGLWSKRVVTFPFGHTISFHFSRSTLTLRCTPHVGMYMYRGTPREGHRFDPTFNQHRQQPRSELALPSLHFALHAHAPLGSSRAPAQCMSRVHVHPTTISATNDPTPTVVTAAHFTCKHVCTRTMSNQNQNVCVARTALQSSDHHCASPPLQIMLGVPAHTQPFVCFLRVFNVLICLFGRSSRCPR